MSNSPITGRCWCGTVSYESKGKPAMAIKCYCRDCQKISGSSGLPQLGVPKAEFDLNGPIKSYIAKSDAGTDVECGFCETCGSPIYKTTSRFPDTLFLAVGLFDDLSQYEPGQSVYKDNKPGWDKEL